MVGKVVAAVSAVGIVGIGVTSTYIVMSNQPYTLSHSEAKDSVTEFIGDKSKLGGIDKNKSLLVAHIEKNKDWWDKAFVERRQGKDSHGLHTHFSTISKGYGTDDAAMSKKCNDAYAKGSSELNNTAGGAPEKLIDSVKKLCTVDGVSELEIPAAQ